MKGLFLKDLYTIEKYIRTALLMLLLLIGMGIVLKSAEYAIMVCLIFSVGMSFTCLSADEQKNWQSYALTMPINRKQLVLEKYIFSYGLLTGGFLIAVLIGEILPLMIKAQSSFLKEMGVMICSILIIVLSLILPLALNKGVEKARYIFMGIMFLPSMLVAFLGRNNMITMETLEFALKWGKVVLPVVAVVSVILSYNMSIRIFEKREL